MTEFKVGDKVRAELGCNNDMQGGEGVIVEIDDINQMKIKLTKSSRGYSIGQITCLADWRRSLEVIESNYKPKAPTHVVIWDEQDRDPHKFFTDEKEAKDFTKELSDKSNVKKESIILVEIKSAQKVNITKNVRLVGYKI